MKLDEATAVLRPRSAWEAVDLGCALARRHWGRLMSGWLTVALPLWAIIVLLLRDHPLWAGFLIWWTKPVLTRQPVFFLSRALFGPPPGWRDFWRDWRGSLCRGLLAGLTVRRFSFQRSFVLPVTMLEGQTGRAYRQRVAVLSAHGGSSASSLGFVAINLEMVVAGALTMYLSSLLPNMEDWFRAGFMVVDEIPNWFLWVSTGFYAAAVALIEPFYSAAGFALYINSRTHLEGWDIEVIFRRMSVRLMPPAAVAACMIFAGLLYAGNANARTILPAKHDAKTTVEEVLRGPDFELEKKKVWIADSKPDRKLDVESSGPGMNLQWIGFFILGLAVVLVAWLLYKNRPELRPRGKAGGNDAPPGPRVMMGMDIAPESLPEDIPDAAWREYEAGRPAEAMRLLYRGSLSWLVNRAALPVHDSDTEGDCLRHAGRLPDTERVSFFTSLTAAWMTCAYAGDPPAAGVMKQLCDRWPFSLGHRPLGTFAAATACLIISLTAPLFQGCSPHGDAGFEERTVGYKGAARLNPWLAAEKMLNRMGTPAAVRGSLGVLPGRFTALVVPLEAITSRGIASQLLGWAANGGHLVVPCAGADRFRNDWRDGKVQPPGKYEPLLEELDVKPSDAFPKSPCDVVLGNGPVLSLQCKDKVSLDLRSSYQPDVLAGSERTACLASFPYGTGRVTLLASATPFRNRWIGEADHAAILYNILQLGGSSAVVFINRTKVNLWEMLVQYAWMPLIAAILLIALWLWRHLPRFGPALPASNGGLRDFGTQLDEAGAFLRARAGPAPMLAAARRSVLHAAEQRGITSDAPDFIDQLAARTGLPAADIRTALMNNPPATPPDPVTAAATLQKLQQGLGVSF